MIVRIYHEWEGGIEKSVPRITDWHHEACRVMTNGDPEGQIIRIYHVFKCRIEKSVPRITDWHHGACRVMTNGGHKGRFFLSHPHTNNGFFFLLTTKYLISYWKNCKRLPENHEYAEMRHGEVISTLQ